MADNNWRGLGTAPSAPYQARSHSRYCEPFWAKQPSFGAARKLDGVVAKGSSP